MLLLALALIWGTSYILIKKGLIAFTPVELACLRLSISFVASVPFAIKALSAIPRDKFSAVFLIGFFGNGIPAFLFALSLTKSGSAVTGILNSLSPLWTLLVGIYFFKVVVSRQKVSGVIVGFMGAMVLVLGKRGENFQTDALYSLLPVAATLCYGISSNIMKEKMQTGNPIYVTSLALMTVGLPSLIGLFFTSAPAKIIGGQVWPSFACIAILSLFGTLIAWMLFYRLVQRTDALFAASVTYLAPIVAIGWGLLDGEVLNFLQLLGMLLILTGVYFTTSGKTMRIAGQTS